MAQPAEHDRPREYLYSSLEDLRIDSVTVTGRELGRGAYGVVTAVEYNGALCAGKQLHSVFFHGTKSDHKIQLLERFIAECRFHSRQHHPNIVQLLGVHFQPAMVLPMLVMELLDTSLQHFLEDYDNIPTGIKNRILLDVSLGLLHLHSQMVVHRDLTASNVLLTSSMTAKITDLGMARIIDPRVIQRQCQQLTAVPGAQGAMAPEACTVNAVYNYKLDVFSYGVLVLQVHTQVFPSPDEALYRIDSSQPSGRATLTAIERRRTYIDMLEGNRSIHSLVLRCLSDDPDMRPTTSSIVQEMNITCLGAPPPPTNALLLAKKLTSCEEEVTKLKAELEEERKLVLMCKLQLKVKEEELKRKHAVVESLSRANTALYQMVSARIRRREKPGAKHAERGTIAGGEVSSQALDLTASGHQSRKQLSSFVEQGQHCEVSIYIFKCDHGV